MPPFRSASSVDQAASGRPRLRNCSTSSSWSSACWYSFLMALRRSTSADWSALSRRDHGELFLGQPLKLGNVRFNDLVQIGGAERPVADAGEKRVGPRLKQLLAVAGKLELALEFLMGNARAAEIGANRPYAPIGKGGRVVNTGRSTTPAVIRSFVW